MVNRYTAYKKRRRTKNNSTKRYMIGGAFMEEDIKYLKDERFTDEEIKLLNDLDVSINIIINKINYIKNNYPDYDDTKIKSKVITEVISEFIVKNNNNMDLNQDNDMNDIDKGGSRKRKYHKINKKSKKNKKHRQRGGQCYGRGVGSNSYEPNYSIYNTNMLKLFPYKT
jgi:hypothetical protein